jgi:hypothetical protein
VDHQNTGQSTRWSNIKMPLQQLAEEIIRLSQRRASTPVLVTPKYLSLRKRFFLELIGTLAANTERSMRIDWYRPMPGNFSLVGDWIAAARVSITNRAIASMMAGKASGNSCICRIQVTASIGRPGGISRELVIGLCDERLELPPWASAIRLGGSPEQSFTLQSPSIQPAQ